MPVLRPFGPLLLKSDALQLTDAPSHLLPGEIVRVWSSRGGGEGDVVPLPLQLELDRRMLGVSTEDEVLDLAAILQELNLLLHLSNVISHCVCPALEKAVMATSSS